MLYSQAFRLPESGIFRVGTIGGSALDAKNQQVGWTVKPRYGLIKVYPLTTNDNIRGASFEVEGYFNRQLVGMLCPGEAIVELPCSVIIRGSAGPVQPSILLEAWELDSINSRGGAISTISGSLTVPPWASTIDVASGVTANFFDSLGANVGSTDGPVVGFSIPPLASSVTANGLIIVRQN